MTKLENGTRAPKISDATMLDAIDSYPHTLKAWNNWDDGRNFDRFAADLNTIEAWCRQHGMKKSQWETFRRELLNGSSLNQKAMLAKLKLKVKTNKARQSVYSRFGKKLPTQKMLSHGFRCGRKK